MVSVRPSEQPDPRYRQTGATGPTGPSVSTGTNPISGNPGATGTPQPILTDLVRRHAVMPFDECVTFLRPPGHAAQPPAAPVYTDAQKRPPQGKSLPTDLRQVKEKDLLAQTGGNGALWSVGDWKPGARPLILVHGIGSDFADLQPLIDKYKNDPSRQIMVYAYSDLGEFTEENGVQLAYQMHNLQRDYPWAGSADIVAHSMGGIVARRALNELAAGQYGGIEKFKDLTLTAVDTPWHGFPGPGIRLNFVQGGMDMQASSEMFSGTDEMPDEASRRGLTGVKLPGQVKVNLLFADNEAAGLKRDGIKDYTDFVNSTKPAKLDKFVRAMTRGSREDMQRAMPRQDFNLFSALQADRQWPALRQEMMDLQDSGQLNAQNLNRLLERYLPRFAGEHSGVLGNPRLLEAVDQRLGKPAG